MRNPFKYLSGGLRLEASALYIAATAQAAPIISINHSDIVSHHISLQFRLDGQGFGGKLLLSVILLDTSTTALRWLTLLACRHNGV